MKNIREWSAIFFQPNIRVKKKKSSKEKKNGERIKIYGGIICEKLPNLMKYVIVQV